jgi:hypothetical protein
MSFPMPPAPAPTLARKPFDLSMLPPEIQARIAAEGQYTAEDGSTIYADGTYTGAGDSPGDYGMQDPMVGGGYAQNPNFMGAPAPTLGAPEDPALAPADPFMGPQFDRYFTTANAGFPGTPGGVGGGPLNNNPRMEPMLDPFADAPATEVSEPVMIGAGPTVTPPADAVAARRQIGGVGEVSTPGAGYGGRMGRRMMTRQSGSRPMPGGRRR